ncbi:MAG: HAD family phosphatase [Lachnospiraceae bacterium]|nr:HAD family phosphatase [Lachnospiraceae bacterium]MBQ2407336.1 HAD family phosphatase [Lachnospiraceae bacterium]MEE0918643.1 HAD family phosphatase [Lachnospiraceae bacterium]
MIKAVVFDMDGVLIDTEKHYYEAWQEAARSFGYDFRSEHALMLRSCDANVAAKMMKGIFGEDFDYFAVREVRRGLVAERLKKYGLEKKPGLDEILDYLKQNGIKTAVATATPIELTLQHLTKIGVKDKFDKIVSAKQVANGKPAPDVYLYACEQIGENPSDCIAVEDSPNGIKSAYAAGCKPVMVPDLTQPDDEIKPLLYGVADTLADINRFI